MRYSDYEFIKRLQDMGLHPSYTAADSEAMRRNEVLWNKIYLNRKTNNFEGLASDLPSETFYNTVNQVAKDNSFELQLGLGYVKYRFWKAIFCSKPGLIILGFIILGVCTLLPNVGPMFFAFLLVFGVPIMILVCIVAMIVGGIKGVRDTLGYNRIEKPEIDLQNIETEEFIENYIANKLVK
jgi:hypothetical protein